jgi:hypothetical protein
MGEVGQEGGREEDGGREEVGDTCAAAGKPAGALLSARERVPFLSLGFCSMKRYVRIRLLCFLCFR